MRGIHREREAFRFRKRRTTALAKAQLKMFQEQNNYACLNAEQQDEEEVEQQNEVEEENEEESEASLQAFEENQAIAIFRN
jgi:hypothetical protein